MNEQLVLLEAQNGDLRLTALPVLTEEDCVLRIRASFSPSWEVFSEKYALLWREGGETLHLPLTAGECVIPPDFTETEAPFYLRLRGEEGKRHFSTNQVCGAFLRRN